MINLNEEDEIFDDDAVSVKYQSPEELRTYDHRSSVLHDEDEIGSRHFPVPPIEKEYDNDDEDWEDDNYCEDRPCNASDMPIHSPVDTLNHIIGDPHNIPVAKYHESYYVDFVDLKRYMNASMQVNYESALNDLIDAYNDPNLCANKIVVILGEEDLSSLNSDARNTMKKSNVNFEVYKSKNWSYDSIVEAAFTFFPKIEQDPEMRKYMKDLKEAKRLCDENGINTKSDALKALRIACRITAIIYRITSILYLPAVLSIIGIIPYLILRGWDWLFSNGEEALAKSEGRKTIDALNMAISRETNKEVIAKLQAAKEKVISSMNNVDSAFD